MVQYPIWRIYSANVKLNIHHTDCCMTNNLFLKESYSTGSNAKSNEFMLLAVEISIIYHCELTLVKLQGKLGHQRIVMAMKCEIKLLLPSQLHEIIDYNFRETCDQWRSRKKQFKLLKRKQLSVYDTGIATIPSVVLYGRY